MSHHCRLAGPMAGAGQSGQRDLGPACPSLHPGGKLWTWAGFLHRGTAEQDLGLTERRVWGRGCAWEMGSRGWAVPRGHILKPKSSRTARPDHYSPNTDPQHLHNFCPGPAPPEVNHLLPFLDTLYTAQTSCPYDKRKPCMKCCTSNKDAHTYSHNKSRTPAGPCGLWPALRTRGRCGR